MFDVLSEEELRGIRDAAYRDEDPYKYAGNCAVAAAYAQKKHTLQVVKDRFLSQAFTAKRDIIP